MTFCSLTYLPSTVRLHDTNSQCWIGQDRQVHKWRKTRAKTMPNAWGKSLPRLNRQTCKGGMPHVYLINTKNHPKGKGRVLWIPCSYKLQPYSIKMGITALKSSHPPNKYFSKFSYPKESWYWTFQTPKNSFTHPSPRISWYPSLPVLCHYWARKIWNWRSISLLHMICSKEPKKKMVSVGSHDCWTQYQKSGSIVDWNPRAWHPRHFKSGVALGTSESHYLED